MTTRLRRGSLAAQTLPDPRPHGGTAVAWGAAPGFLMAVLASTLILSMLAGIHVSRPSAAGAGIHVFPDGGVAVVLCVVDAAAQARCFAKDDVLAGALDGTSPALCGLADRPLTSPCPAGRECAFPQVAMSADAFGLVLLEPRAPLFGVPRHRLVDAVVLAPEGGAAPPQIAAGVRSLARCFAPSAPPPSIETVLARRACENEPCRLRHSSVRVDARRPWPARDQLVPPQSEVAPHGG